MRSQHALRFARFHGRITTDTVSVFAEKASLWRHRQSSETVEKTGCEI
jgi:hypothetical protein